MYEVPVLILGFNRPDLLSNLIMILKHIKPNKLFFALDGPRTNNALDKIKVKECESLMADIDWDCELYTLLRDNNLGCGKAVSSAIDWAFEYVNELVILEDDVVPSYDFFAFCKNGLTLYKDDENIMTIGGHNSILDSDFQRDILSVYPEIWGWATWKQKWAMYNFEIRGIGFVDLLNISRMNNFNFLAIFIWLMRFMAIKNKKTDTWDYQLIYSSFSGRKFHLISSTNQVLNLGFDDRATHTTNIPLNLAKNFGIYQELKGVSCINKRRDRIWRQGDREHLFYALRNKILKVTKNIFSKLKLK